MDEKDNQHEVYMKLAELSHQACEFTKRLNTALKDAQLPIEFFSSFRYTENKRGKKGKNRSRALTHPIMLSLLHCLLQDISADSFSSLNITHIGVDARLYSGINETKPCRLQPDIVGFSGDGEEFKGVLFIDYESPNSSDNRVIDKDVRPYQEWCKEAEQNPVYIVLTTLPDQKAEEWGLWYKKDVNNAVVEQFSGETPEQIRERIRRNPKEFWYQKWYRNELNSIPGLILININGEHQASLEYVGKWLDTSTKSGGMQ